LLFPFYLHSYIIFVFFILFIAFLLSSLSVHNILFFLLTFYLSTCPFKGHRISLSNTAAIGSLLDTVLALLTLCNCVIDNFSLCGLLVYHDESSRFFHDIATHLANYRHHITEILILKDLINFSKLCWKYCALKINFSTSDRNNLKFAWVWQLFMLKQRNIIWYWVPKWFASQIFPVMLWVKMKF
jgi:hypothetical protein